MEIIRETKFDFMKYRRFWLVLSAIVMALGLVAIFFLDRLNLGIDFTGGTQVTLKFKAQPDVQELRQLFGGSGLGEIQLQRFGAASANEILVRTPVQPGTEEGTASRLLAALNGRYAATAGSVPDLNQIGALAVGDLLAARNPDGVTGDAQALQAHYETVGTAIMAVRKEHGLISDWSQLSNAPGVSAKALELLRGSTRLGDFSVLAVENVGPQVGAELRQRGILAVVFALGGMLLYIWLRFELRFGVGALMASLHDVLITLGLYAMMGYEFNLTTIAAFLTLVGYSVNDTVVTFDRVRENMRAHRSKNMLAVLNLSLNQMLSRTLLTGGTTILASLMLFLFGGEAIKGFAFIIMVGIVVGTYSSIYIASPFTLLWEQWFGARKQQARS